MSYNTRLLVPAIRLRGNILVIKINTYWACLGRALHSEASCLKNERWQGWFTSIKWPWTLLLTSKLPHHCQVGSAAPAGLSPTLRGTGCTSPLLRTLNSYLCNKHTTNEQYHCDRTGSIQLSFYRHISQSPEYPKQAVNKMMNHQHSERVSLQFRLVQPCFTSLLVSSEGHDTQTKQQ